MYSLVESIRFLMEQMKDSNFHFISSGLDTTIYVNSFSIISSLTLWHCSFFGMLAILKKKTSNYHKALVNMLCKFYKNQVLLNYEYWFLRIASMQNRIKRFYWHKIKFGLIMYTIDKNDKTDEFMRKILTHRH